MTGAPATSGVSLARRSLTYEWRRYLAAVLAVAFSGLLVIVQLALLLGLFRTVTTVVDRSGADLWVGEAAVQSFDLARDMPERVEFRVRSQPGVERVERLLLGYADWRAPDGRRVTVTLVGLNVDEGSLAFPRTVPDGLRRALLRPGGVLVERADLGKLGLSEDGAGDSEINGRRVSVAGIVTGFRSVGGATIFTAEETFRSLTGSTDGGTSYLLVRLADGSDAATVQARLNRSGTGLFRAMTPEELSIMSQSYWLLESGTGVGFLFSTVLGLLVGVAITSQTLRAAILASLREYATLRALDIPLGALRAVVLEQSFWVGVAGLCITALGAAGVWWAAAAAEVSVAFTGWSILGTALFTMLVSLVSGLFSLGPLYRTEPAELLR